METIVRSASKEVLIAPERPTVLIGERLNPTGKKKLAQALTNGDLDYVSREALAQAQAGADILDINVGLTGLDESSLMVRVVETVSKVVNLPLCLDSHSPETLRAALAVCGGRPLINSVNAEGRSLETILPLAKEFSAAVIALPMDELGIPDSAQGRLELCFKIIERAAEAGLDKADIVFDGLAMTVGADQRAGRVTLDTIRLISERIGCNQTLGVSNVSFGLPERCLINQAFLTMAVLAGVDCPVVDVAQVRAAILATDLALGRDPYARRYLTAWRQRSAGQPEVGG
jgi:5-methyltetrahydrofolate--homocysteine methyltransferase